jgi:hypothetical protein
MINGVSSGSLNYRATRNPANEGMVCVYSFCCFIEAIGGD